MSAPAEDTRRAIAAARAIVDGRGVDDSAAIMVTLEQTVATVLLALFGTPAKAAAMLNEGLLQGVEERLAWFGAKGDTRP